MKLGELQMTYNNCALAWIVADNYRDGVAYTVHGTKEAADAHFLEIVKDRGKFCEDPMIMSNDADDFDELVRGGIYNAPNGDMIEVACANLDMKSFGQKSAVIADEILTSVIEQLSHKVKWGNETMSLWRNEILEELCNILENGSMIYKGDTISEFYRVFYPCFDNMGLLDDDDHELSREDVLNVMKAIRTVLEKWRIPPTMFLGLKTIKESA